MMMALSLLLASAADGVVDAAADAQAVDGVSSIVVVEV